jgi:long-chain acyl-CoA synthetase
MGGIAATGAILTEQGLIDFVAGKIARYKKPGYVEFVDSLPKRKMVPSIG